MQLGTYMMIRVSQHFMDLSPVQENITNTEKRLRVRGIHHSAVAQRVLNFLQNHNALRSNASGAQLVPQAIQSRWLPLPPSPAPM